MAEEGKKTITLTGEQLIQTIQTERTKIDLIQQRINTVQRILTEAILAMDSIKELTKKGNEGKILVNLGSGIYVNALVEDVKKFKRSMAGNIILDSTPEETLEQLKNQREKAEKSLKEMQIEQQKIAENMNKLSTIIASMRQEALRQQQK
ncbi:MAG: prefoldin subunit alpha [archaeon]